MIDYVRGVWELPSEHLSSSTSEGKACSLDFVLAEPRFSHG